MAYSIHDQIAEVARELALRERLYPQWVTARKLSQQKADDQLGRMRAVLSTLQGVQLGAIQQAVAKGEQD